MDLKFRNSDEKLYCLTIVLLASSASLLVSLRYLALEMSPIAAKHLQQSQI